MGQVTWEQQYWLIEPLLAVGLGLEEIRSLVSRLGFEAVVGAHDGGPASLQLLVRDQPLPVQGAWTQVIDRMLAPGERAGRAARAGELAL